MICNKCNHNLPEDSEFCQYCGNKMKKVAEATISPVKKDKINLENNIDISKQPTPNIQNDTENLPKKSSKNNSTTFMSKRLAVVISLLLCVILYLLFLTTVFTSKRDTYICYTTKTGAYFHSAVCKYIDKSAYQTTVYEACHDYKPCSSCHPYAENYKTTITVRNYIYPILISVPISILVFILLGCIKGKQKYST